MTHQSPIMLREGMREGDLVDLVLPLISCDEYVSVIDPTEAIVIGFYIHDEDAAKDLNRFLQKSAVPLLGTDVSPAPDQHGYFMVFVEMMDNDRLAENLTAILHEMSPLVGIDNWQLRARKVDGLMPFNADNLRAAIKQGKHTTKKSDVVEYLQHSALHNAEFVDRLLILEGAGERYCFDFIDFGRINTVLREHKLDQVGVRYDLRSLARSNKMTRMLGESWTASQMGDYILLHTETDLRGLLLKA